MCCVTRPRAKLSLQAKLLSFTASYSFTPTSDEPDENWSISLVYASKSLITGITPTKKASCSGLAKFLGRSVDNQVSKSS